MTGADPVLAPLVAAGAAVELIGRIAWSSNATFLVEVSPSDGPDSEGTDSDGPDSDGPDSEGPVPVRAVYKPEAGERPLFDFPEGIWRREVAAYELARALGWDCIPETVTVEGPLGEGSLQRFVDADFERHYFTMVSEDDPDLDAQLRRLCCFDLIANNTDRKGGHCLVDEHGHVWGIDNALCFHAQYKLRTVIWDFAGEPVDAPLLDDITRLLDAGLPDTLDELLDPFERDALRTRAHGVVREGVFPHDETGRRYPWPLV